MGGTIWSYFVPYEPDAQLVLTRLRDELFQSGNYHVREAFDADTPFEDVVPSDADQADREALWEQYQVWRQEVQPESFASIDALHAWNADEGTHSILDVWRVSAQPLPSTRFDMSGYNFQDTTDMERYLKDVNERFGIVYPLSEQDLLNAFGTTRPTRPTLDANKENVSQLFDRMERGTGIYIVLYADDVPRELFFTGFSGD